MQQCLQILKSLQTKDEAAPFLEPVDWYMNLPHFQYLLPCRNLLGLPDYPEVIKKPMDLGTIEVHRSYRHLPKFFVGKVEQWQIRRARQICC